MQDSIVLRKIKSSRKAPEIPRHCALACVGWGCLIASVQIATRVWLTAAMVALTGLIPMRAETDAQGPIVTMTEEIQVLAMDRTDPQYFRATFVLVFTWDPRELPGFRIEQLEFLNRSAAVDQRAIPFPPRSSDGRVGVLVTVRGHFESSNDYAAYPFNIVRMPIIFETPRYQGKAVRIVDVDQIYNHAPEAFAVSDGYKIKSAATVEGRYHQLWDAGVFVDRAADVRAIGMIIDAEHRPERTVLMVFVPLLLIWGVIYSSLWWKEESACSRAVMASLFAVTALAFSSINLQPNVSYLTTGTLAFGFLYLNLAVVGTFSILAFRANKRADVDSFRRNRHRGRIAALALIVLTFVSLTAWVVWQRSSHLMGWLEDEHPVETAPAVPAPTQM